MGRAIEVDNRLDKIEADLKWVINLLNQFLMIMKQPNLPFIFINKMA